MMDTNPYQAPRAELGAALSGLGDLQTAVADFKRSRTPLLLCALMCAAVGLFTIASLYLVYANVYDNYSSVLALTVLMMGSSILGYFLLAGAMLWGRHAIGELATPERLTRAMTMFAHAWLVGLVCLVLPVLSTVAVTVLPALGAALTGVPADSDLIAAARRWHGIIRAFVIVGAIAMLLSVGGTILQSFSWASNIGLVGVQTRIWLFGGVIVRVGVGYVIWQQVPALDAFIEKPTAATLAAVASAHRRVWGVGAWALLVVVILSTIGRTLLGFML